MSLRPDDAPALAALRERDADLAPAEIEARAPVARIIERLARGESVLALRMPPLPSPPRRKGALRRGVAR